MLPSGVLLVRINQFWFQWTLSNLLRSVYIDQRIVTQLFVLAAFLLCLLASVVSDCVIACSVSLCYLSLSLAQSYLSLSLSLSSFFLFPPLTLSLVLALALSLCMHPAFHAVCFVSTQFLVLAAFLLRMLYVFVSSLSACT